jgi:hypothetical protein
MTGRHACIDRVAVAPRRPSRRSMGVVRPFVVTRHWLIIVIASDPLASRHHEFTTTWPADRRYIYLRQPRGISWFLDEPTYGSKARASAPPPIHAMRVRERKRVTSIQQEMRTFSPMHAGRAGAHRARFCGLEKTKLSRGMHGKDGASLPCVTSAMMNH